MRPGWDGQSFFVLLRVPTSASDEDIKAAWRKLASRYHPDRNPGYETTFTRIRIAYNTLSDPIARQEYIRYTRLIGIEHILTDEDLGDPPPPENTTGNGQRRDLVGERVVGIDLGTTNSVVAILNRGTPEIIPNSEGGRLTPSVVAFSPEKGTLVGSLAKRQAITNAENTVLSVKRHMGSHWSRSYSGHKFTAPDVAAEILKKLKTDTEAFLGEEIKHAVITVPAYFNHNQRRATQEAGQKAGLNVVRIINEPTAAAVAFSVQDEDPDGTYLIFDLGGGTLDVTILRETGETLEVLSSHGDTRLGGDDWDEALIKHIAEVFRKQTGLLVTTDLTAKQRLKEATENAKIELSTLQETEITLPFLAANEQGPQTLEYTLTREELEKLTKDLLERCRAPFHQALTDSGLDMSQIDHVVLAGGSTRMPAVRDLVQELTGKEPRQSLHPEEAIAIGAAIQGGIATGEVSDLILLDITSLSLGVETHGRRTEKMIDRNSAIPTEASKTFSTATDNQERVEIHVVQGEHEMVDENESLGKFELLVEPAPARTHHIEVHFRLTMDGTLVVSAVDKSSGKEGRLEITAGNITKEKPSSLF